MGNNYGPNYELCLLCCKTNVTTKSKNKKFWKNQFKIIIGIHNFSFSKSYGGSVFSFYEFESEDEEEFEDEDEG